ncbi:MAG: PEP-CTERM sorting domain-containing protein, partial [Planctomycetota bacterium]
GGYVEESLRIYENCRVFIHGSNFQIDGAPVDCGPVTVTQGRLTGDLLNGYIGSGLFINDNASVTLIPEPATLALLGAGTVALWKKRKMRHSMPAGAVV